MKTRKNILFDKNNEYSREEKWKLSARVSRYIIAALVLFIILVGGVVFNIRDLKWKSQGKSIVYEYRKGTSITGVDENGNKKVAELGDKIQIVTHLEDSADGKSYERYYTKEYGKSKLAAYKDDQGILYTAPLHFFNHSLLHYNRINLYYQDNNMADARPLVALWAWIVLYVADGFLLALFALAAYRIMYPKSHIQQDKY